jgi:hypothetical protein
VSGRLLSIVIHFYIMNSYYFARDRPPVRAVAPLAGPLQRARFNLLGDQDDTHAQARAAAVTVS